MNTKDAIDAFLCSSRARGLSLKTIQWYAGIFRVFSANYKKLPRRSESCEEFILSCPAGDERRHGYYRALHALYNFACRRLGLKNNPMLNVTPPHRKKKLPRPLAPEQLNQLLSFPHPARVKAALLFLTCTGARLSEMLSLDRTSFMETEWGPVAFITGKTGERIVPLDVNTYNTIMNFVPFNLSPGRMSRLISRAFRDARVPGSAINLRHTFGTLWEGDEHALQLIMGHSRYTTTQQYRQLRVKTLIEQHAKYCPLKMVLPLSRNML